jgi:hypothetical protein
MVLIMTSAPTDFGKGDCHPTIEYGTPFELHPLLSFVALPTSYSFHQGQESRKREARTMPVLWEVSFPVDDLLECARSKTYVGVAESTADARSFVDKVC